MSSGGTTRPPALVLPRTYVDGVKNDMVGATSASQIDQTAPTCSGAVLTYDSGNCSISSNASDTTCPFDMELHTHCQHMHTLLKERDEALCLAMQDVRKLRSELERLNKSEEWYKTELRAQKSTRLETLERLYGQERKYMQENQRLQRECVRLYDKCGDMEKEVKTKQEKDLQKLIENEAQRNSGETADKEVNTFELERHRSLIDDQQNLINVLRKQKQALLEDLKRLSEEKDTKVLELQEALAGVEVDNMRMTGQCKRLLTERKVLEATLQTKEAVLNVENIEKKKMQAVIEELNEQCNQQEQELARKENAIQELQRNFKHNMLNETNMDEVHRLSVSYLDDINAKTAEITSLKKSLRAIQIELNALTDQKAHNEELEHQIEYLNFALETRQCELSNIQGTDEEKTQQITELQQSLEKIRTEHDNTIANLHTTASSLKNIKRELIAMHEQYAAMCSLCERTRFELELLKIEKGKLCFQAGSDKREIELLRVKLMGYLKHTEELGARISELENNLKCSTIEKEKLLDKLKKLDKWKAFEEHSCTANEERGEVEPVLKSIQRPLQQNKELVVRLSREKETLRSLNDKEEDDSGFLDGSKDSLSVTNDSTDSDMPDSQVERVSVCSSLTVAHNTLLEPLSTQREILKQRQSLIAAFEQVICNESSSVNKDFGCINKGQGTEYCGDQWERQEQLMEYFNTPGLLTLEKRLLLEAFETLINEEVGPQEISIKNQEILEMKKVIEENKKLKILLSAVKEPSTEVEPQKLALGENDKCSKLEECVNDYSVEVPNLQIQLLVSEEKQETNRSEQEQLPRAQSQTYEETIQRLQADNVRLVNELQSVLAAKSDIEGTLQKQRQFTQDLKAKVEAHEKLKQASGIGNTHQLLTPEKQELFNLRAKIQELEVRLQAAMRGDEERRTERVQLIQKLLEQQNSKVKRLAESQGEWEEMLAALQTAQKLEENTRAELHLKHAELEELNALFAEQNEELRRLQEVTILADGNDNREEIDKLRQTFQQQLEEAQTNLSTQLTDSQEKQRKLEELQRKNERLERRLNEDYAEEILKNQRQLRALQTKMENLQTERNSYAERIAEMEIELQQLKKNKREGLVLPPEFMVLPRTVVTASSSLSSDGNASSDSDNNDRMRILTKVLEAEYRRKMKRYDLHIHTLLGNIKKLKKALRTSEQRATHLAMKQSKTMEELRSLQLSNRQLEDMRLKCEHNQSTIKALEHALEMERKKFEASDLCKATCRNDSAALVLQRDANLIDDYKKLIQQSALATQRPKTSAILDLIQRSNQCVPNLHKLETTVGGLRSDLEHFLSTHALHMTQTQISHKLEGPSLMDELRAAAESY